MSTSGARTLSSEIGLYWMDTLLQIKALLLEIGHDYLKADTRQNSDHIFQNQTVLSKIALYRSKSDTIVGIRTLSWEIIVLSFYPITFYLNLFSRFFSPLFKLIADPRGEGIGDSVEDEVAMDTSSVNSEGTETEPAVQPQVG